MARVLRVRRLAGLVSGAARPENGDPRRWLVRGALMGEWCQGEGAQDRFCRGKKRQLTRVTCTSVDGQGPEEKGVDKGRGTWRGI